MTEDTLKGIWLIGLIIGVGTGLVISHWFGITVGVGTTCITTPMVAMTLAFIIGACEANQK